jgi:isocitrate/isopropylmalate dehydrogenase
MYGKYYDKQQYEKDPVRFADSVQHIQSANTERVIKKAYTHNLKRSIAFLNSVNAVAKEAETVHDSVNADLTEMEKAYQQFDLNQLVLDIYINYLV